ncbi:MAG: hypothetical protein M1823_001165 [Watsoniomyces obsoletus]|nr:MAG: hypothetical protein M1823_001165 [Watsoniomyces obsoletus]
MATTMATAAVIPIASRPSLAPPTTALPPLPTSKTRRTGPNNTNGARSTSRGVSPTNMSPTTYHTLPRPARPDRTSSASLLPSPSAITAPHPTTTSRTTPSPTMTRSAMASSKTTPAPAREGVVRSASEEPTARTKDIRRSVSMAAFPPPPAEPPNVDHPPIVGPRKSSLPVSPLSSGSIYRPSNARTTSGPASSSGMTKTPSGPRKRTMDTSSRLKRTKGWIGSNTDLAASAMAAASTLPRDAPDRSKVSSPPGGPSGSDTHSSLQSLPVSRCSSGHGSSASTATTLEDGVEPTPRITELEGEGEEAGTTSLTHRDSKRKDGSGNVIVSVRVRPDGQGDQGAVEGEWIVDGRRSLVAYRGREGGNYHYDHVFGPNDRNAKVYDSCAKRLVRRVMEGYHGTVFAYGMTGTGKTFSMQGTASSPGVIPLAITDIFSFIRETPHREFLLRVSYLEIYNERIHDLLSVPVASSGQSGAAPQQEEIKLREDSKRGVYATPLKEEIVQSPTQLLRVIARGDLARRTSSTQHNSRSSRSHAVVQIVVESRDRQVAAGTAPSGSGGKRNGIVPGGVRVSTLSLIDLAGSERAAESKERRTEGAHINKSLLTLGTVIGRLSNEKENKTDNKDGSKHLPYRDSKLTRLLQPALAGNSLISILCTIQVGQSGSSAAPGSHTAETLNTLKFASRAKNNIVSHAKRAEEAFGSGTGDAASRVLLERYRVEIQELRSQLENQAKEKRVEEEKDREKEVAQRHEEQMLEMQLARTALKERIEHLNRLILCSKSTGVNTHGGSVLALATYPSVPRSGEPSGDPRSTSSARSSSTPSTLGAVPGTLGRTGSNGSNSVMAITATPDLTPSQLSSEPQAHEEEDLAGEYGDGMASLAAQVRALQADLTDKNRYIATLEKRLLQARRSSYSRTSRAFSPPHRLRTLTNGSGDDHDLGALLEEKDHEIADLRARLDDKDHMVTALRSAARKRDLADGRAMDDGSGSPLSPTLSNNSSRPARTEVRRLKTNP